MRKLSILALVALFVTGSAFAAGLSMVKTPNATFSPATGVLGPTSTNNDDTCDISTAPAATLLLPYFEVDLGTAGTGRTTVFSVTNVSPYPQIAHVVLYTDWSFPVLDFNIFLTGYDVQPINLYDVIARGLIGDTSGTSYQAPNSYNSSGFSPNPPGAIPYVDVNGFNASNPNFILSGTSAVTTTCAPGRLPGQIPTALAADVRALLSTGKSSGAAISCTLSSGAQAQLGGNHGNTAIGYATIDVAATCSTSLPTQTGYFTGEILFDNVLIGDYYDINQSTVAGNYAGGNPMVHIRAVPEGGPAGAAVATNLPFTFYDRYLSAANVGRDRRQPLPSIFAARWISGGSAFFDTQYKIWREGFTGTGASCASYALNSAIPIPEVVRFDEHENAAVQGAGIIVSPFNPQGASLPETSRTAISSTTFPQIATTDVGGWTYLNLNNGGFATAPAGFTNSFNSSQAGYGATAGRRDVSQNWVIISMFAEGRYGVDYDAAWLGNGCSGPIAGSGASTRIAPAGGVLVCPTGTVTSGIGALVNCHGTNVTPVPTTNTTNAAAVTP